jgi:hypothetical protein
MPEMTFILDELSGELVVESPDRLALPILEEVAGLAGTAEEFGCARPLEILPPPTVMPQKRAANPCGSRACTITLSLKAQAAAVPCISILPAGVQGLLGASASQQAGRSDGPGGSLSRCFARPRLPARWRELTRRIVLTVLVNAFKR